MERHITFIASWTLLQYCNGVIVIVVLVEEEEERDDASVNNSCSWVAAGDEESLFTSFNLSNMFIVEQ